MSESENIDLPNNLSVAEGAIKQFQAISAHEEDEFIKLSDIVDPPQPTLDLTACLNEIQDDICIVTESNPQCNKNNATVSTVKVRQEPLMPVTTSCDKALNTASASSIQTVHSISEYTPQPALKKRGRKRKNENSGVVVNQPINTSSENITSIDQCAVPEKVIEESNCISTSNCTRLNQSVSSKIEPSIRHTTRRQKQQLQNDISIKSQSNIIDTHEISKPRKRGRPKKINTSIIQKTQSHNGQDDCILHEIPSNQTYVSEVEIFSKDDECSNYINTDKEMSNMHQNNAPESNQCLDKITPRKRGRPKKSKVDSVDNNCSESDEVTNTSSIPILKRNSSDTNNTSENKNSKTKVEDKKYDEIELELIRMLSTPTEELEEKCNNKSEIKQKPSRKRGRKSKMLVENAQMYSAECQDMEAKHGVENENIEDEMDDICLSSLKKRLRPQDDNKEETTLMTNEKVLPSDSINETSNDITEISAKRNTKKPIMSDFEYNVDTAVSECISENITAIDNLNIESPSKRPIRKKTKKVLHYDEGSDEDPFANVELSDEDGDLSGRRGGRYYSDDEYIPGKKKKGKAYSESESSLSESDELEKKKNEEIFAKKLSKKKGRKSVESLKKKNAKKNDLLQNAIPDVTSTTADTTTQNDDDLENTLQSPDITTNESSYQKPQGWGISNEFESFIAQKIQGTNLKIKKLSRTNSNETAITPLEIPVLDPNEPKKTAEISTQTNIISRNTVEVQASSPYESIMKCKVPLTAEQSEKACEFLKSIVKNTSELGQLMIQKSEDFIQKKINTKNVTDTTKMDYCVQKSFLLFKLAKHNLIQMEEDLANEYEQFLQSQNMSQYRESPKCIMASAKQTNSDDSDCEIVEEPIQDQEKAKSKFNLKTVFLNKELSIKIAKKSEEPQEKKAKVSITGGRHTVWINDSIMVKKVKPTQSFLAQDSRNKKPPDTYISIEMVKEFFDNYYKRQKVLLTCAPFVSSEWLNVKQIGICNYFITQSNDLSPHSHIHHTSHSGSASNIDEISRGIKGNHIIQPTSLISLCIKTLHKYMSERRPIYGKSSIAEKNLSLLKQDNQPNTLFRMSFNVVTRILEIDNNQMLKKVTNGQSVSSLKKLCLRNVNVYIQKPKITTSSSYSKRLPNNIEVSDKTKNKNTNISQLITNEETKSNMKSLFSCCVEMIQKSNLSIKRCDSLDINENNISFNIISDISQPIANKHNKHNVKSLFSYCVQAIQKSNLSIKRCDSLDINENNISFNIISDISQPITNKHNKQNVKSLFSCCVQAIQKSNLCIKRRDTFDINENNISFSIISDISQPIANKHNKQNVKSLFSCCVQAIQKSNISIKICDNLNINENNMILSKVKTLKCITFENVKLHLYHDFLHVNDEKKIFNNHYKSSEQAPIRFARNYTDHAYNIDKADQLLALTIKSVNTVSDDIFAKLPDSVDDDPSYSEDDDSNFSNYDEYELDYSESNQYDNSEESNWVSRLQLQELKSCVMPIDNNLKTLVIKDFNKECVLASIKIEPLDETSENIDNSVIKTEVPENDEIVFNPLATKVENSDNGAEDIFNNIIPEQTSSSYDVDAFEEFARTNKLLQTAADYDLSNDDVFSQSTLRIRKQHEPDMDDEFDTSMSLLVPQQSTDLVKDRLMKSSSDEESNTQKNVVKKKRKIRPKISRQKPKDVTTTKNKKNSENEVASVFRKMQVRIRQDEKSDDSADSDFENSLAKLKHDKSKKELEEKIKLKTSKQEDNEIQCNDVDSTEHLNEKSIIKATKKVSQSKAIKMSLRKKIKENKIMNSNGSIEQDYSYVIQPDTPVESLECEPTLPMMHDDNMENIETETENRHIHETSHLPEKHSCIDRHGWKCYPVNNNDTKLYEHTYILLEKLPEFFVKTYLRYQGVTHKNQEDSDIDRLTNLQSLHRSFSKDNKIRSKTSRVLLNGHLKSRNTENDSRPCSPTDDDHFDELTPSEDEGANVDGEMAAESSQDATENVMAKNSLMNDMDSESEKPTNLKVEMSINKSIKKEKDVEPVSKRYKPGPKSKKSIQENDSTLLTADKMMNKELALLHAPVTPDVQHVKVNETTKKSSPKNPSRTSTRLRAYLERTKLEDESSSEEEKQWVTTKEKLLKRMGKKRGNTSVDDAKRAKIVSEFIEKRGDAHEKRPIIRTRKRRSRKKFLERKKQMSVLNRELFGETDTSHTGRKYSQAFGKGRRNIRKVIDKKSLARSTVVANMEEFERKRRLNLQQTRLREQLGCEEGVNVLVINGEVCLEYDFEQMRPVVTIHPFFTRVMKAHQYEGVKFMWDACFESLAMVSSGHAGGGCILAHCMGLGKTLQVLALLHTVLTHPGVGIKRVLVCCPLSTVLNWVDEINKWIGPVTNQIKVFELSKLKKTYERAYQLEDWYKDGGIFIIGYELFRSLTTLDPVLDDIKPKIVDKIRHALLNPGPDVVICDEGHLLKNDASVLAVAMSRVATRRRIVLTGTPMQNNLREYYCMVNFVKPSLLGTYAEYSNRFENPIINGQHRDSQEEDIKLMKARTHILHKVLEGCLQRQEASVLYPYLPKKHEYTVFIPPTKCQWDLYKHYIMTYALEQQDKQQQNKQQKQNLLKDFHVLQKIWTHPQVLHNFLMKGRDERNKIKEEKLEDDLAQEDLAASEDVKPNQTEVWWLQYLAGGDMLESLESSNKFVVVFQLLDEFITLGDKVLIFSTSLYTLDALEYFLKRINKWSLGQEYFRLDGSVPAEVRQKWCREFNAPSNINTKLFLISTRAGCLGLNMTAANRVIILDTSWNPAHDIQSIFRVYRFGQKKDCYIYRLVAMGTMEQKIYERSVTKQAVSCRVVDEQQIDRHYNMAELTDMYRYDEEGATVEAGLAAGVSDVALLRVAARARLHAVREHDSLLRGSREQHLPEHERNAAWMQFQQEHAHNEMQDRLLKASQGIQQILDANYADPSGLIPLKTEIGEQPQQMIPQSGSKGKKSKKKATTNLTPPIEDPKVNEKKDMQLEADKEEAKVKKIMQLLIKHNFHTSQRAHEISQLVANVRSIVDSGGVGLELCDELTRSIATVMLQEEDTPILSSVPPPLTDIITGDIIMSPSRSDAKLEMSHEAPGELSDAIPEEINRIQNQNTLIKDPGEESLLVPVIETARRQRLRPRKYFSDEIFEPMVKRSKRKITTDTEQSSIDDDTNAPLRLKINQGTSASIGKKSKRLMGRPRRSYASDRDSNDPDHSSKEQSSEIEDESLLVSVSKQEGNEKNRYLIPDSDVTLIDDEDTRSKNSESLVVTDMREKTTEPNSKPRRAIAVKSTSKVHHPESNLNGKIKRKAALAAEVHLEKLDTEDIVTLDDDDEWVGDSDRKFGRSTNKVTAPFRGFDMQNKNKSKTTPNTETKSSSQSNVTSKKQEDSTILLSDDEDRTNTNILITSNNGRSNLTNTESEEPVPLHPSMLSNANFIKIVAYAYQSNRMLDEDAALLAARYSTQKALKEYETTGKDITNGPIYDIAVKMLTKDILRKLHNKKGSNRNEASLTTMNSSDTSSKKGRSTANTQQEVTLTKGRNPSQNYDLISSDYTSQPNVVPIEMFKGSAMNQKSHEVVEECILPNDDEDCIGSTNGTLPRAQNVYKKSNTQPLIITSVKSRMGRQRESQPVSATETVLPETENPITAAQSHNNMTKSVSKVEPFVTLTERPQFILGPNCPTHRLSKSNVKIDPTLREIERSKTMLGSHPQLTLTISEGKLVQSHLTANNVTPIAKKVMSNYTRSSNDTICLDSDEEDVGTTTKVAKIINLTTPPEPIAITHTCAPTPVAVTTSVPSFSGLTNVQGVMMRINNAHPQGSVSSVESQTKANQHGNGQQTNFYLFSASNLSENLNKQKKKLPKSKPAENANRDVPQIITKKIIRPEDVLNKARPDQIKKVCKPGDIVRITKQGSLAVLSRIDHLPDNLKSQLSNVSANSSEETNSQQSVADKRKPSTSGAPTRACSPGNDPLSILKDVIHIQADEYDESTNTSHNEKADKSSNSIDSNKQTMASKIQSKQVQYTLKKKPDNDSKASSSKNNFIEPVVESQNKEFNSLKKNEVTDKKHTSKPGTIDLTNIIINNKNVAVVHKSIKNSKNSVIVGSSKDIIIRAKPVGSTLAKASTSMANIQLKKASITRETDNKKRSSPWPDLNSPKKKRDVLFRPAQTLEDFDIDDIDDIIELE